MTIKPGMPFAGSSIAQYLTKQIDSLSGVKSQREIAVEVGYDKPNMISMLKRGEAKVPLDKIPALAKALHVDPAFLFRLAMEQYWPDLAKAISSIFGTIISKNEASIIDRIRELTKNGDPALTPELDAKLVSIFEGK